MKSLTINRLSLPFGSLTKGKAAYFIKGMAISAIAAFTMEPGYAGTVRVNKNITVNTTWTKNNTYVIQGTVAMLNNAMLTIDSGTLVTCDSIAGAIFRIEPGSKIKVGGTEVSPQFFVSTIINQGSNKEIFLPLGPGGVQVVIIKPPKAQLLKTLPQDDENIQSASELNNAITIFPNPAAGNFEIHAEIFENGQELSFSVWDVKGRIVHQGLLLGGKNVHLDLTELPSAIYYLRISDGLHVFSKKIIIQK